MMLSLTTCSVKRSFAILAIVVLKADKMGITAACGQVPTEQSSRFDIYIASHSAHYLCKSSVAVAIPGVAAADSRESHDSSAALGGRSHGAGKSLGKSRSVEIQANVCP